SAHSPCPRPPRSSPFVIPDWSSRPGFRSRRILALARPAAGAARGLAGQRELVAALVALEPERDRAGQRAALERGVERLLRRTPELPGPHVGQHAAVHLL